MTPEDRDEELLAEFLKGDSEISRLYRRDAREQPGARLDARILSRARREVEQKRRVVHSPFARHWMVPTSLAAVLVLTVSVIVLMPEPVLESEAPGDSGLVAPDAVRTDDAKEDALPLEPLQAPAASPAPATPRPRREQAYEEKDAAPGGRARENLPSQAPVVRQPAGEAVGKSSEKRKSAVERDGGEALAPAAGAASTAAPGALEESDGETEAMPARAVQDDPERWLHHIERLLDQQLVARARHSLRAFRTRYPDFPLPSRLVPLAENLDAERQ